MPFNSKKYQAEYYQKNKDKINEYRRNYNKNVMNKTKTHFGGYLDRELIEQLEKKLKKDNLTKSEFLRKKIIEYLEKD